jgi:hypothetical protein
MLDGQRSVPPMPDRPFLFPHALLLGSPPISPHSRVRYVRVANARLRVSVKRCADFAYGRLPTDAILSHYS